MLSTKSRILAFRLAGDLQPEIEWDIDIEVTDLEREPPQKFTLLDWSGEVVFYKTPRQPNGYDTQRVHADRRRLPARLLPNLSRELSAIASSSVRFVLATPADAQVVERLETFRAAEPLHVRAEGTVATLLWPGLEQQLGRGNTAVRSTVLTECLELPRDRWCEEFLPALLPPGRLVLEADLSSEAPQIGERLKKARRAFYEGRYEDMVREIYVIMENVRVKAPKAESDPEETAALRRTWEGIRSLLNLYRHRNPSVQPLDRATAKFILFAAVQADLWIRLGRSAE